MKTVLRIVAFLLAAVFCLGVLCGCSAANQPLKYLKDAIQNTIDARFGGDALDRLDEILNGGSVSVIFGGTDLFETALDTASLKAYFNIGKERVQLKGNMTADGEIFDGTLWLTDEKLVISSPTFLGSNNLGIDFDSLAEDIKNSIFRNDSNTDYAQSEIDGNTAEELRKQKEGFFKLLSSLGDLAALGDRIVDEFFIVLADHAMASVYSKGGSVKISMEINNHVLSRALRDTRSKIAADRSLCRELRNYAKTLDEIASAQTGIVTTARADALETFLASDARIEVFCAMIDSATPFALQIDASVKGSNTVIETLDMTFSLMGVERLAFNADLTDKNINYLALTVENIRHDLTYRVVENKLFTYEAAITYRKAFTTGEEIFLRTATLQSNKWEDTFTFALDTPDGRRVYEGTFDEELTGYHFAVRSVTVNGESHQFLLSVDILEDDPIEALPQYVNLFTVSEARYATIHARIKEKTEAFARWQSETDASPADLVYFLFACFGIADELP